MSEVKHTPGPWQIAEKSVGGIHSSINGAAIIGAEGTRVGTISPKADKSISQKRADAYPSGDNFDDWAFTDFEYWCEAPPLPPVAVPQDKRHD